MTIRILYQFATAKQHSDLGMAEVRRREDLLNSWAEAGIKVEVATPAEGPLSIESDYDAARAIPSMLASIAQAERDGFDAAIISCFSDPGLEPARELVGMPVLASGLCAMHTAAMLGHRFSIISPRDGVGRPREHARRYAMEGFFVSARGIGLSVLELARDREGCIARMTEAARLAVEEDGAETLILGCMSMAFHDVAARSRKRLACPWSTPHPSAWPWQPCSQETGSPIQKRLGHTPPALNASSPDRTQP